MTIAIMALTGLMIYAYVPSKAVFTAQDGRGIRVFIDGRAINKYPRQFVSVNRIRPGKHRVTVELVGRRGRVLTKRQIIHLRPGFETRFNVERTGRRHLAMYRVENRPRARRGYKQGPVRYDYDGREYNRNPQQCRVRDRYGY